MLIDLAMMAVVLAVGNVAFWKFDPFQPLWRRGLKIVAALLITAVISHLFGRKGVLIWFAVAALPIVYVHGFWLPRHGVNGWTGEPKEKYNELRGWPPSNW
jgi:hypothetical protein